MTADLAHGEAPGRARHWVRCPGKGGGEGGGPVVAGSAQAMAYAKSRMGTFGWNTGNDFDALVTSWMGESG